MTLQEREKLTMMFDSFKDLLSQSQRQALHLYLIEDLTITEIANILVTSRQAANDAIKKGAKKLISINKSVK